MEEGSTPDIGTEPPSEGGEYSMFALKGHGGQPMVVTVQLNSEDFPMEVDTGASLSITSEAKLPSELKGVDLKPTTVKLYTYTGESIPILGSLEVRVDYHAQSETLPLIVVKGQGPSLLGRNWLQKLRLDWKEITQPKVIKKSILKTETLDDVLSRYKGVSEKR